MSQLKSSLQNIAEFLVIILRKKHRRVRLQMRPPRVLLHVGHLATQPSPPCWQGRCTLGCAQHRGQAVKTGLRSDTERPAWDFVGFSCWGLGCGPAADMGQAVGKGAPCGADSGGEGQWWAPSTVVGTLALQPPL